MSQTHLPYSAQRTRHPQRPPNTAPCLTHPRLEVKETALSLASSHAKAAAESLSQGELSRALVHAHAAESASRSIPAATDKFRGPHPLYLRAIELLADTYEEQGDRKKELSYRCELCAHNETSLGTEHLFTLAATKSYASLLADGGELERARPPLEKAVEPHGQECTCSNSTPLLPRQPMWPPTAPEVRPLARGCPLGPVRAPWWPWVAPLVRVQPRRFQRV